MSEINGFFKFVLITIFFSLPLEGMILSRNNYSPDSYSSSNRKVKYSKPTRMERRLIDEKFKIDAQKYGLHKKLSANQRELKLLKIAKKIIDKANKKNLTIDKVTVGSNLKKMFHDKDIVAKFSRYLNDKHLNEKINKLQGKLKKKNTRKLTKEQKNSLANLANLTNNAQNIQPNSLGSEINPETASPHPELLQGQPNDQMRNLEDLMKFQYHPGIGGPAGGLPSLPISSGVHFHPPINITVNKIPDANPHASLNPLDLQRINLKEQTSDLSKTHSKLMEIDNELASIGQDIELNLSNQLDKLNNAAY